MILILTRDIAIIQFFDAWKWWDCRERYWKASFFSWFENSNFSSDRRWIWMHLTFNISLWWFLVMEKVNFATFCQKIQNRSWIYSISIFYIGNCIFFWFSTCCVFPAAKIVYSPFKVQREKFFIVKIIKYLYFAIVDIG